MPKYYCDYCDTFLTHDSASVRKSHIEGVRHQAAVRAYYAQFDKEHQEAPDREALRFEKLKGDAMQFMMAAPPPFPMPYQGGFPPPFMPPGGSFPPPQQQQYPPYGGYNQPQNQGPRFDSRNNGGWKDRNDSGHPGSTYPNNSNDRRDDFRQGYGSQKRNDERRDDRRSDYGASSSNDFGGRQYNQDDKRDDKPASFDKPSYSSSYSSGSGYQRGPNRDQPDDQWGR